MQKITLHLTLQYLLEIENEIMKGFTSQKIEPISHPTIWQKVVGLVHETKGVNLSQGAPQFGPQPFFIYNMEKASKQSKKSEYKVVYEQCDSKGIFQLREAIANYHARQYLQLDPKKNILVVAGASVGLFVLFMAFIDPGDQVLMFEPAFDFYRHYATIFSAKTQNIKLQCKNKKTQKQIQQMLTKNQIQSQNWEIDWQSLKEKVTKKTKLLILNSPHNPTGKIFTQEQIDQICQIAIDFPDLVIIEDNVYEGFTFDEYRGKFLPKIIHSKYYSQLKDRVINVYSAGKLLEATGIRCGWVIGPKEIIDVVHGIHKTMLQSVTYMVQKATAQCLDNIRKENYYYLDLEAARSQNHRRQLLQILSKSKYDWKITVPKSGYFILVDISNLEIKEKYFKFRLDEKQKINPRDLAFCYQMAFEDGVVIVPCSSFFSQENKQQNLIRFALCKNINAIQLAGEKIRE